MLDIEALQRTYPHIYESLRAYFNSQTFPCLFAKSSFNKRVMLFSVCKDVDHLRRVIADDLASLLYGLEQLKTTKQKSYYTGVFIVENEPASLDEQSFIIDILRLLRATDRLSWPKEATANLNEQSFSFYWQGQNIFPVLVHPNHPEKIRQSPYLMLAVQPGRTFDYNQEHRKSFYERARVSIHKAIDRIYSNERPYYLSSKASGKNICQYSGVDPTNENPNYQYPNL